MKDKLREQVTMIMDQFDFEEVGKVMEFVNWPLRPTPSMPSFKPNVDYLKNLAMDCLNKAVDSEDESVSIECGPFEANKEGGLLELKFVVQKLNPLAALLNPERKDELARKA